MAERSSNSAETHTGEGPFHSDNDRVEHLIEQLKQRTAELEEANRELRRVSHYRSLFLARMSHELRTPLTSILGFSEILLLDQELLSETQRRFCKKIQDSGLQLQASLNQLVDLSRLEAGQTELFFQEFSVREMLRESCAVVARYAQKRQVTIEYELTPDISTVVSDQGKLRQVVYSFLSWAVSRSPEDSKVRVAADLPDPSVLRIVIDDQAEHVPDIARVFDPESSGSHEPDVNDLGIIIGRRLLEVMNGTLELRNKDSRGMLTTILVSARPATA
jgi:two-component system, NarL family, sensor histidine kinase BarA